MRKKNVDIEVQSNIVFDYLSGTSNKHLCEKYDLHRSTIQSILIKNGVKLRKQNETARKHQIIDENYFNEINCEDKAYFLGILYADGSINKNGFEITLTENDLNVLEKLSTIIYGKINLSYIKAKPYHNDTKHMCKPLYRLTVVSNTMKNDLIKNGCVQAKTYKIRMPNLSSSELYRCFIRGYFDGDGCFSLSTRNKNNSIIYITSNIVFCNELNNFICNNLDISVKSFVRYGDIGGLRITKTSDTIKFMNWIYENSNIHMDRKFNKYKNYILTLKKEKT